MAGNGTPPSAVTCPSCIGSRSAAWVFGVARLISSEQVVVTPQLVDASVVHHDDQVRSHGRAQPMRDQKHGAPRGRPPDRVVDGFLVGRVQCRGDKDYPLIQGVVLVSALGYVLVNLLVDLSYSALGPRIRHCEAEDR